MAFKYIENELCILGSATPVKVSDIAFHCDAPVYVYDLEDVLERYKLFHGSFSKPVSVHYAVKANANPTVLESLGKIGSGVDVVSGGEIEVALEAGIRPDKIVFSGVGKTVSELTKAIDLGIKQINVESPQELVRIAGLCKQLGAKARVAFRMNPDVDPETHPYIKTGFRENKFGMDESFLPELLSVVKDHPEQLDLVGLTMHIGSQLRDLSSTLEAIDKTRAVYEDLLAQGFSLKTFDVGGGLGINYEKEPGDEDGHLIQEYGRKVSERLKGLDTEVLCEPGRILTARSGVLLGQIQYIKKSPYKNFAILNTGMHHLIRPSLYQAYHRILEVQRHPDRPLVKYDVVGPICESSDVLGLNRELPELESGEWLAIADSGAYGYSMASLYNAHALAKEVVVYKGQVSWD